jgi:8-oxo-dGTP pyrophosphatase MutT (NUDIX family)
MFRYCPSCASGNIHFEGNRKFVCPDCGFTYYHNTAAAAACIIVTGPGASRPAASGCPELVPGEERIVFLVRGREPGLGGLDLPGGFIDPGEGVEEGLRRECREELGFEAPRGGFSFLASFPNVYPYKNIVYNTCDMFFTVFAPGIKEEDFRLEKSEVLGIRILKARDVKMEDLAFDSVRRALRAYMAAETNSGESVFQSF